MKIKLEPWAKCPERAHQWDAGIDLFAPEDITIPASRIEEESIPVHICAKGRRYTASAKKRTFCMGSAIIDTGVHVKIPKGFAGIIKSKSGLLAQGITCEGTIDYGYTGSIKAVVYNHSGEPFFFEKGQKVTQLVVVRCRCSRPHVVKKLGKTKRGAGGFGSTGR